MGALNVERATRSSFSCRREYILSTSHRKSEGVLRRRRHICNTGYVYDRVTGGSGSGDHVGPFESRVIGVGPQIGHIFPLGSYQGYLNLNGYGEFDAHDRPSGYNAWLTLSISPAAPTPPSSARPQMTMYT
jgi:hypothetical protein